MAPSSVEMAEIGLVLLAHRRKSALKYEAPWLDGRPLSMKSANKFLFGALIDFRQDADRAWNIARHTAEVTFGDPPNLWTYIVDKYPEPRWHASFGHLALHRFQWVHDRVRIKALTVVKEFGADARKIWEGRNAAPGPRCPASRGRSRTSNIPDGSRRSFGLSASPREVGRQA